MTSTHIHAVFFGGPQDGAIFPLSAEDIARGHVDAVDAAGNWFRYSIVELREPRFIDDKLVERELRPAEGNP